MASSYLHPHQFLGLNQVTHYPYIGAIDYLGDFGDIRKGAGVKKRKPRKRGGLAKGAIQTGAEAEYLASLLSGIHTKVNTEVIKFTPYGSEHVAKALWKFNKALTDLGLASVKGTIF